MKKLIIIILTVVFTASAQAETNYKEWTQFIGKVWDCKAEIKKAGKFTGCSGFAMDYMHLMDDPDATISWDQAPTEYQEEIQRIIGIDLPLGDDTSAETMKITNDVMLVALDFICEAPEGKAWMIQSMTQETDQTSIAGTLIGLSLMNSIFCNQPADTDFSKILGGL